MINLKALEKANKVSVTYTVDDIDSEYVKAFRKEHNLTQTALANLLGVCLRTVVHWENGKSKVTDTCARLFTLFSKNKNLINDIRTVKMPKIEDEITPLTITKNEYSGKWVAWHLPSDKVVEFTSEGQSQVFWKCTRNFYLLGVGNTEEEAVAELEREVTAFIKWIELNRRVLSVFDISSNLPEYRNAIFEFNTEKYF